MGAVAACVGGAIFCFFSAWLGFRLNKTRSSEELRLLTTTDAKVGTEVTVTGWIHTAVHYPRWLLALGTVFSFAAVGGALWVSLR